MTPSPLASVVSTALVVAAAGAAVLTSTVACAAGLLRLLYSSVALRVRTRAPSVGAARPLLYLSALTKVCAWALPALARVKV